MRFVCDSCRAQYMISDEKVGAKGVKVRCKKCGFVILVRKPQDAAAAAVAAAPPAPVPPPDEGVDATQVMQNPLATASGDGGIPDPDVTSPGINVPAAQEPNKVLAGVADDEIGAVFDQVLQSGSHKLPTSQDDSDGGGALGDGFDDRMSTRVIDAETVRKLAEETAAEAGAPAGGGAGASMAKGGGEKALEPPKNDWFVAIDEKQVGPLSVEQVKQHWDKGEIGPDSLCWRAGFSDWVALSEVEVLASVLAPQPKKPVIVASASMEPQVESAFGPSRGSRSEPPASSGSASADEDSGWKPSAASALASLVKEEIEALARPAPQPKKAPEPAPVAAREEKPAAVRGILELPSAEHSIPAELRQPESAPAPAPVPARAASSAGAPLGQTPYATSMYRTPTPPRANKALIAMGVAVLALLLVLSAGVVWLLVRDDPKQGVVADTAALPPTAVAQNAPVAPPNPVPVAPAAAATPEPKAEPEKAAEPAAAAAAEAPAETRPAVETRNEEPAPKAVARRTEPREEPVRRPAREEPKRSAPAREERSDPAPVAEVTDDFEAAFGGGSSAKPAPRTAAPAKPAKSVYVPPAPGSGGNLPERLESSDIMTVVVSNRAAIKKCVDEQKAKDPGASGRLVMRWVVKTNGRTSNVSCQTADYKSSHLATCVGGLIKGWRFPAHKVQGEPIDFPFTF